MSVNNIDLLKLYNDLNKPSAGKFKKALEKRGIQNRLEDVRKFIEGEGARQLFQKPPEYKGKIYSPDLNVRWAADVISYVAQPSRVGKQTFTYILIVQDIFSRLVYTRAMVTLSQTTQTFQDILRAASGQPKLLTTDKGSEWSNQGFKQLLERKAIEHVFKEGLNDLGTIDRAIKSLREALARHMVESGKDDWATKKQATTRGLNALDNQTLGKNVAPEDVDADQDEVLKFNVRHDQASNALTNSEIMKDKAAKLTRKGAFRTANEPTKLNRAFKPNWKAEIHEIANVSGGHVEDTKG